MSSLTDEYPVTRLIDFAHMPMIQIGIADNQPNPRHFPLEYFDCYRKHSADGSRMLCQSNATEFGAFRHSQSVFSRQMPVRAPRKDNRPDKLVVLPNTQTGRLGAG